MLLRVFLLVSLRYWVCLLWLVIFKFILCLEIVVSVLFRGLFFLIVNGKMIFLVMCFVVLGVK